MHEIAEQIQWLGFYLFWISVWLFFLQSEAGGIKSAVREQFEFFKTNFKKKN